ncbi:MAG: NifB/NifX family molybdenum-iron cluster-binding protein [Bacteroidota bacterium]
MKKEQTTPIYIAFATNKNHVFESKHFGDAELYHIYTWDSSKFSFSHTIKNSLTDFEETDNHGNKKKGLKIRDELQKHNVQIIVSKQFGTNITIINYSFIPIIISDNTIDKACKTLKKYMNWLCEELADKKEYHKLFIIRNGILKKNILKQPYSYPT